VDKFDETVQKAKDVFESAVKKTEEFVFIGKQKISITALENKLSKAYIQLGKLQFNALKDCEIEDAKVSSAISEIKRIKSEIQLLLTEVEKVNGKKVCPNCKNKAPGGSGFCNKCGTPF
jgi:hypothetical protein